MNYIIFYYLLDCKPKLDRVHVIVIGNYSSRNGLEHFINDLKDKYLNKVLFMNDDLTGLISAEELFFEYKSRNKKKK